MKKHPERIALPRELVGKGTYMGERQAPRRAGAEVHDQIPSRVGETLHYRDGRKEATK